MQQYRYRARRSVERLEEGVLEAESAEAAVRALTNRGMFPMSVQEVSAAAGGAGSGDGRWWAAVRWAPRRNLRLGEQALVSRQLADLLEGGLTVHSALGALAEQAEKPRVRAALADLQRAVRDGQSLSDALDQQRGRIFPPMLVGTVRGGEASGSLEGVLRSVADLLDQDDALLRRVREVFTYPAFVAGVGALTLGLLFGFVIPRMTVLYEDLDQALPLPTRVLLLCGRVFSLYGIPVLLALLLTAAVTSRRALRSRALRIRLGGFLLRLPVVGKILRYREIVRFARALSTLVRGGVPVVEALELTARATGNAHFAQEILGVRTKVREGSPLAVAFRGSAALSGPLVAMVDVGEEGGRLPDSLDKSARLYERDLDSSLKRLLALLEPLLIVGLAVMVAFIVFSMMLPILQVDLGVG
ncbi:MAG: type II secretion system F family protein [Candidatus Krumholzibacteriia bacterium]